MSTLNKGDVVRYGKEEYTVDNVRQIPYGQHFREKATIIDKDGNKFWVDTKDLKPISKEQSLDSIIKEAQKKYEDEKTKEQEKPAETELVKKNLKEKKSHPVSFAVVSRDYVNGRTNGYEAKETIVTGRTKDGINYEATVYGKGFSKGAIEKIADNIVKENDLTTSKQDNAYAMDRINSMLNDNNADYIVYINGDYRTGYEINDDISLQEAENLEDTGDLYPDDLDIDEAVESLSIAEMLEKYSSEEYTSQSYDSMEEEMDDLFDLAGVDDITER